MKLSILIPSVRPEGLAAFEDSLKKNSLTDNVELVILVDDEFEHVEFHHNRIVIHRRPEKPLSVATLMHECYKLATGDWIMFGNDDVICETRGWDEMVTVAIEQFGKDGMSMFWPDDNMFGIKLACFPIISRKFLDLVEFFPLPYQRYKVDDTIFGLFPTDRKYYLSNIKWRHLNDKGEQGYVLGPNKVYPILMEPAIHDNARWIEEESRRIEMRERVNNALGKDVTRVYLALMTKEDGGRRADFYDNFDGIETPEGVVVFKNKAHGQSPARGRNMLIDQANQNNCTHILFVDDDVYVPGNVIKQLLQHNKDIVTGLYYSRSYPHKPYIFREEVPDGSGACVWGKLRPNESGLIPIAAAGLGVCLVNMRVFEKMEKPYIRLGEYEKDQWCDDLGFFNRARAAGFEVWCDLDCRAGHSFSGILWPQTHEGLWVTGIDTKGDAQVTLMQIMEEPVKVEV